MADMPAQRFRVWINPQEVDGIDAEPREAEVTIRHVDRVAAERAALPLKVPGQALSDTPLLMTTTWIWAALRRLGLYTGPLTRFVDVDCLEIEDPDEDKADDDKPVVPPTDQSQDIASP